MDVSNGIRTTDPHMISIHGFVDILELSFPALAVILSIFPRTGNWVAVCIVYCSLSLRNDDRPVTFLRAISPIENVKDFSERLLKEKKISDHIESLSPRLNRVTYLKQFRNNMHNIRIQAISLHFLFAFKPVSLSGEGQTLAVKCAIQSFLKVLSETFLAPAYIWIVTR